jgi:hypothetical protein
MKLLIFDLIYQPLRCSTEKGFVYDFLGQLVYDRIDVRIDDAALNIK